MKTKLWIQTIFLFATVGVGQEVNVVILDDTGKPVVEAEAQVIYDNPKRLERYDIQIKKTDSLGSVSFTGDGPLGATIWAKKKGYYSVGHRPAERLRILPKELVDGVSRTLILRRVLNPIPLFYKRNRIGSPDPAYKIPKENEWIGFDLQKGDWVAPHGEGETSDILFRYRREFLGIYVSRFNPTSVEQQREDVREKYKRLGKEFTEEKFREEAGKWDGVLEIAFPNQEAGILKVTDEFMSHSVLHLPHRAPVSGYKKEYQYEEKTYTPPGYQDDLGFFLRTRVERDEEGEIKSAHYAKIHGDFQFSPVGYVRFTYYFNPTPNDRNLEFSGENLFPEDKKNTYRGFSPVSVTGSPTC